MDVQVQEGTGGVLFRLTLCGPGEAEEGIIFAFKSGRVRDYCLDLRRDTGDEALSFDAGLYHGSESGNDLILPLDEGSRIEGEEDRSRLSDD